MTTAASDTRFTKRKIEKYQDVQGDCEYSPAKETLPVYAWKAKNISMTPFRGLMVLIYSRRFAKGQTMYKQEAFHITLPNGTPYWSVYLQDIRLADYPHMTDLADNMVFRDPYGPPIDTALLLWVTHHYSNPDDLTRRTHTHTHTVHPRRGHLQRLHLHPISQTSGQYRRKGDRTRLYDIPPYRQVIIPTVNSPVHI